MSIFLSSLLIRIDARVLLFFGLSEQQTPHLQPITGTPVEVPEPRNKTFIIPMRYQESQASQQVSL